MFARIAMCLNGPYTVQVNKFFFLNMQLMILCEQPESIAAVLYSFLIFVLFIY